MMQIHQQGMLFNKTQYKEGLYHHNKHTLPIRIFNSGSEDGSQISPNEMTMYNGGCTQASTGASPHQDPTLNPTQSQHTMGETTGTQTSPPQKVKSTGGTQTSPPKCTFQDQGTQGSLECNLPQPSDLDQPGASNKGSKGKKRKKKSSKEGGPTSPHPGTSTGTNTVPRMDFISRNLGTGRPQIQCTACGEYSHWSRACPYNNFCTNCNDHSHATHMCRTPNNKPSPVICIYCGNTDHKSSNCHNKPWDNCEQPCPTLDTLRQNQQSNTEISGSDMRNATSSSTRTGINGHTTHQATFQRSNAAILGNAPHGMGTKLS